MGRKTYAEKVTKEYQWLCLNHNYTMSYWEDWDYSILKKVINITKRAGKYSYRVNDVVIMADTETSKKHKNETITVKEKGFYVDKVVPVENHVVAWSVAIRAFHVNIVTLWGRKPSDCVKCLQRIHESMAGDKTHVYFHNLTYDWQFLRKFIFRDWGFPSEQLNTKSHYPINIEFENGIILKDSLILAQRSLDKWASDLKVPHQKAVGKWRYDKIRGQAENFNKWELEYIEHDVLAGVECIDATCLQLHKTIANVPMTATGIPRKDIETLGKANHGHELFEKTALAYDEYMVMSLYVYHGGYVHGNRALIDYLLTGDIICYDFASSYPFQLLANKFPIGQFAPVNADIDRILRTADDMAYFFKLIMVNPRIKGNIPMPVLQFSKCTVVQNPCLDNGRILGADYVEIWITEQDLILIEEQYKASYKTVTNVKGTIKGYLPRWITDYVYKCFTEKTMLKGGDPVQYSIAKAKVNSIYGMFVQKYLKDELIEDYKTGVYSKQKKISEEEYAKYLANRNHMLPYQVGCWVTAYAMVNLHRLGECCDLWIYSDTDSVYGKDWNLEKLEAFNVRIRKMLTDNGYGPVIRDGREYWLGVAELDSVSSEFKVLGAKRYCKRTTDDNELHITVAGVPKKGAACLKDDINKFTAGLVFGHSVTGKMTHSYIYREDIYIDENGCETGDSIDLNGCDYLLDSIWVDDDWEELFADTESMDYLEEEDYDESIKRL